MHCIILTTYVKWIANELSMNGTRLVNKFNINSNLLMYWTCFGDDVKL